MNVEEADKENWLPVGQPDDANIPDSPPKLKKARKPSLEIQPIVRTVKKSCDFHCAPLSAVRLTATHRLNPQGRWGHTLNLISPQQLVLYGGEGDDPEGNSCTFGELFVNHLNGPCHSWTKPINCDSAPRVWHTATFLPDSNLLVTFGGERSSASNSVLEVLGDLMVLDCELFLWYPPAVSGRCPTPRSGHTASLIQQKIIIWGGSRGRKWHNNVIVLDTDRWHWETPIIGGTVPQARSFHSATELRTCEGHMVVYFGGNDGDRSFCSVVVLKVHATGIMEWFHPVTVGKHPTARTGHAACLMEDGKTILIQGGWDPQDDRNPETTYFSDAFLLDTESWEWRPAMGLGITGTCPGRRVGHTATLLQLPEHGSRSGKTRAGIAILGGQDDKGLRTSCLQILGFDKPCLESQETLEPESAQV